MGSLPGCCKLSPNLEENRKELQINLQEPESQIKCIALQQEDLKNEPLKCEQLKNTFLSTKTPQTTIQQTKTLKLDKYLTNQFENLEDLICEMSVNRNHSIQKSVVRQRKNRFEEDIEVELRFSEKSKALIQTKGQLSSNDLHRQFASEMEIAPLRQKLCPRTLSHDYEKRKIKSILKQESVKQKQKQQQRKKVGFNRLTNFHNTRDSYVT